MPLQLVDSVRYSDDTPLLPKTFRLKIKYSKIKLDCIISKTKTEQDQEQEFSSKSMHIRSDLDQK